MKVGVPLVNTIREAENWDKEWVVKPSWVYRYQDQGSTIC